MCHEAFSVVAVRIYNKCLNIYRWQNVLNFQLNSLFHRSSRQGNFFDWFHLCVHKQCEFKFATTINVLSDAHLINRNIEWNKSLENSVAFWITKHDARRGAVKNPEELKCRCWEWGRGGWRSGKPWIPFFSVFSVSHHSFLTLSLPLCE